MRHKLKGRKLNRTSSHRKALLRNLSISFFRHELIKTTLYKAKELRPYIEKIVTLSKKSTFKPLFSKIGDKEIVNKLLEDIKLRVKDRNGGYVRIVRCGFRSGDNSPMAIIELVDR